MGHNLVQMVSPSGRIASVASTSVDAWRRKGYRVYVEEVTVDEPSVETTQDEAPPLHSEAFAAAGEAGQEAAESFGKAVRAARPEPAAETE